MTLKPSITKIAAGNGCADVVKAVEKADLDSKVKIMIGRAPITQELC